MRLAQTVTLLVAVACTGLMAGLFFAFANAVMPGLARSSDRTYVESMQRINESILNPLFLTIFMGGLLVTGAAAAVHVGSDRQVLPWVIGALLLYGVMFVITMAVNVPLNDELDAVGTPTDAAGWADARHDFESRWVPWNVLRAVLNVAAFAVLAWALVLHGRATTSEPEQSAPAAVVEHEDHSIAASGPPR
jgi:uncharacterized membrane protein